MAAFWHHKESMLAYSVWANPSDELTLHIMKEGQPEQSI